MQVPPFNEDIDYKQLSLISELALEKVMHRWTAEQLHERYDSDTFPKTNIQWYFNWCVIMSEQVRITQQHSEIYKFIKINTIESDDSKCYFVTINIAPAQKNIPLIVSIIDDLMQSDWIKASEWVYENYTEQGEHLHVMCKMITHQKMVKSILIQKICRTKGLSKIVEMNQGRSSTFVDVKQFKQHHEDYLDLLKTDKKQKYLEQDETFRKKHNLKIKYSTIV